MERILAALADKARMRILELLAERPRSVGELAELMGARQPQTTKHLQTLAAANLVSVFALGQRRIYAIETAGLLAVRSQLGRLVDVTNANSSERDVVARYQATIQANEKQARGDRWADGRNFVFERVLEAPRHAVWQFWVDPDRLASWWVPPSMTVTECLLEPRTNGRAVLEYRDAEGRYRSEGRVLVAEEPERLAFELSVLDASGSVSFTGNYQLALEADNGLTRLKLQLIITQTTADALTFISGIETGWGQVLDNLVMTVDRASNATPNIKKG